MDIAFKTTAELGRVARIVRKRQGLRIDSLADLAGLSKQFIADVEHGKPTVQMGKVLHLLEQLGVHLKLDLTREDAAALAVARASAAAPRRRPARTPRSPTSQD